MRLAGRRRAPCASRLRAPRRRSRATCTVRRRGASLALRGGPWRCERRSKIAMRMRGQSRDVRTRRARHADSRAIHIDRSISRPYTPPVSVIGRRQRAAERRISANSGEVRMNASCWAASLLAGARRGRARRRDHRRRRRLEVAPTACSRSSADANFPVGNAEAGALRRRRPELRRRRLTVNGVCSLRVAVCANSTFNPAAAR